MPFLGKFRQKNQNCSCNLKFGSESTSNIPNSMVMLTFSVLHWKYPFWANSVQKNLHKLKFGTEYNLSILNLIIIFTFSFLDRKHPFWGKLVQKLKFLFKVEFDTQTYSNMQNLMMMMMFIFSVLDQKYTFWKNWSQIINALSSVCVTCLTLFIMSGFCFDKLVKAS